MSLILASAAAAEAPRVGGQIRPRLEYRNPGGGGGDSFTSMRARADVAAERVFAPWVDMEDELRRRGLPLYSLETFTPLHAFDVLGFTLQYDLCCTNVLTMLDLAGIPLRAEDRTRDQSAHRERQVGLQAQLLRHVANVFRLMLVVVVPTMKAHLTAPGVLAQDAAEHRCLAGTIETD